MGHFQLQINKNIGISHITYQTHQTSSNVQEKPLTHLLVFSDSLTYIASNRCAHQFIDLVLQFVVQWSHFFQDLEFNFNKVGKDDEILCQLDT